MIHNTTLMMGTAVLAFAAIAGERAAAGVVGVGADGAVDGVMTWSVKSVADGTDVTFTYSIGGYAKDGFDELSKMTDHVLGEQMQRFKKSVDVESAPRGH